MFNQTRPHSRNSMLLIALTLLFGVVFPLSAGHLLIRTDGSSQWVRNLKATHDRVTGTDEFSGESIDLDKTNVAAAIPVAQQGMAYPMNEVSNVLARIAQVQPHYPKLLKQLNLLKQGWEPFLKSDATLGPSIERAATNYCTSARSYVDWKAVQSALEMIKYRDARSEFKPLIDHLLKAFSQDYFETNRGRLLALSTSSCVHIETFYQARQLKEELISNHVPDSQKTEIIAAFERCRSNVFQQVARDAQADFKANPSLPGYLSNVALLCDLRDEVAPTLILKNIVTREISNWQMVLQKNNPGLSFEFEGYPFGEEDRRLTDQARRHMPLFNMQTAAGSPEVCFLVPLEVPPRIRRVNSGIWKSRAIFNRRPSLNRRLALILLLHPESGPQAFRRCMELPGLSSGSGHSEFETHLDLSALPRDFTPSRQDDGAAYLIVYLAEIPPDLPPNDLDGTQIKALSKGWGIRIDL